MIDTMDVITSFKGNEQRFLYHRWSGRDSGNPSLCEMLLAKQMPYALDLRQIETVWNFIKRFSGNPDDALKIAEWIY